VCICIPNYNNEKTIEETIESILKQTYKNIIVKIFDNASTDKSIKILKKYEKKHPYIKVFQNETNIGGEANFTKCIQNAEGKYTAVFHADDCYMPNMIEEQVAFLEEYTDCSAVATHSYIVNHEKYNL
jgi:glycosyltransferase involved in cell wall biosynthesis